MEPLQVIHGLKVWSKIMLSLPSRRESSLSAREVPIALTIQQK
ncbi:hypothetical protein BLA13014_01353 [Burkholderia aenigmatica]|uniref:Uncharacterized protein n=1 Tax=Burkholderia aenigmatica TaxID=2015348 RepID=A0A6P2ISM8_9BURK|nr:hypothetical protein BLA13014_01353 [Burkholderia aenigmatica]